MSVEHLAPIIHRILSAPDTDLSTVSAKRVRKQLVELDQEITIEFVKQNKDAIDALIGTIFETMNNPDAGVGVRVEPTHVPVTANMNGKRKRREDDEPKESRIKDDEDYTQGEDEGASGDEGNVAKSRSPATPVTKKAKKAKVQALTDEEYARQLSSELNQRPSRGSRKGVSRTPKRLKKSRAEINSDVEDEDGEVGSSRKRSRTSPKKHGGVGGGNAKGGFGKEFTLSEPLAAVIDTPQLSRPQVVKRLWEYIKARDLQNPKNRKEILCDDALRAVFNSDKIDMFTMNKTLGQHLYELES